MAKRTYVKFKEPDTLEEVLFSWLYSQYRGEDVKPIIKIFKKYGKDLILSLPSDYEGLTIGDVLEKFGEIIDRGEAEACQDCHSMGYCPTDCVYTHNGQPIRRRNET